MNAELITYHQVWGDFAKCQTEQVSAIVRNDLLELEVQRLADFLMNNFLLRSESYARFSSVITCSNSGMGQKHK